MFYLSPDLELGEYQTPFDNAEELAKFILNEENNSAGFELLRDHMLVYAQNPDAQHTNWKAISSALARFPYLPQTSLMRVGIQPLFDAAASLLEDYMHI
jgi:hypothetical protein